MTRLGTTGDDKRKHLEFIQNVINRMASNSFLFKGWSITIIAAVSAFAAKDNNRLLMTVPLVSTILFWAVDAYYLMLERAFRDVYNDVRKKSFDQIDYSLTPSGITVRAWLKVMFGRPVLYMFYGLVITMLLLLTFALNGIWIEVQIHHAT